jgi:MoxR-like ATPase
MTERFAGTDQYIATDDLMMAVNAAITLARPLLIKGEPGTGKTQLAQEIARALGKPLHEWHIKSTSKAQQGLYEYDAVSRLRDSQLGDARVHDIANYIVKGKLWEAFDSDVQPVLPTSSFRTICCASWIGWSSTCTRRASWCARAIARSS